MIPILKNTKIKTDEKTINMSISTGITELLENDDYLSILERVDMALLDAKNKGKANIVIDSNNSKYSQDNLTDIHEQ